MAYCSLTSENRKCVYDLIRYGPINQSEIGIGQSSFEKKDILPLKDFTLGTPTLFCVEMHLQTP